jgi:hypothetical protein
MARPKAAGETVTVNVVFPKTLTEQMDAYVLAFMEQNPGVVIRRSDVVRMAVEKLIRSSTQEPKKLAKAGK